MNNEILKRYQRQALQVMQEQVKRNDLLKEGNQQFSVENKRRSIVQGHNAQGHRRLLNPSDIEKGLMYGIDDVFMTTLGGELRALNTQDLLAIRDNIETLNNQYAKGITAKKVMRLSLGIDKRRANQQIHLVVPLSLKDNVVKFMTNASGDNKAQVHYLHVEFTTLSKALLTGEKPDFKAIEKICAGNIRFECDCGRHTYWYRYLATLGGYGYGRLEHAYPKERNPYLSGVACKHAIRVMQYILSPSFAHDMQRKINKLRQAQAIKNQKTTKTHLKQVVEQQVAKGFKALQHNIKHAEQEMLRLERKRQKRIETQQRQAERKQLAETAKKHGKETARRIKQQQIQKEQQQMIDALLKMGFTEQQIANFRRKR